MAKLICVVWLTAIVVGGAFAQVVVGVGASYSVTETASKVGRTSTETTSSEYGVALSAGYRIRVFGFGLQTAFGGTENKPAQGDSEKTSTWEIGGYFEYALLQINKFSFFGKTALGYSGTPDQIRESYKGDMHGLYVNITSVFEYQMFKHAALFASVPLIVFTTSTWEAKEYQYGSNWKNIPSGNSEKIWETQLFFPLTRGIGAITLGCKFTF